MPEDLERAGELMADAERAIAELQTYSCVIHCHERIKGKLRKPESIFSRFQKPRSVYLRWQKGPYEGLQCSYVPDRDGPGRFMARETGMKGLVGARTWRHDDPMIDTMYPHHFRVHETNLVYLADLTREIQGKAERLGKLTIDAVSDETDPLVGRPATRLDSSLSKDARDGLRWPRTRFWFDRDTRLPLHFILYDFDGEMAGEYAFTALERNPGLPPGAFDLAKL